MIISLTKQTNGNWLEIWLIRLRVQRVFQVLARSPDNVPDVVGNNDGQLAHLGLPLRVDVDLEGHRLIDAAAGPDTRVVVYGHSHKALVAEREGVLWVNPGAAGRVGFHREVTLAFLRVENGHYEAELVLLGPRVPAASRSGASCYASCPRPYARRSHRTALARTSCPGAQNWHPILTAKLTAKRADNSE